jgi:choline dehydrogenase-like flavoprotein
MSIYDFEKERDFECDDIDFIVIGGGIVGSFVSHYINKQSGKKIVVLEAGGEKPTKGREWFQVEHLETNYRGALDGRFTGLGGTSAYWGGALIPVSETELLADDWPQKYLDIFKYSNQIEDFFKLGINSDYSHNEFDLPPEYVKRRINYPKFKNRNVTRLLHRKLYQDRNFIYVLNARVTRFNFKLGLVKSLIIVSPSGQTREIPVKRVIIAAGALESTRMLLDIYGRNETMFRDKKMLPTRSLVDHVSIPIAELSEFDFKEMNLLYGLKLNSHGMYKIKYESSRTECNYSLDIRFSTADNSPRDLARQIMQSLQKDRIIEINLFFKLLKNFKFFFKALYWRYILKTVLEPRDSKLIINLIISQNVHDDNFVELSSIEDRDGIKRLKLHWSVTSSDVSQIFSATEELRTTWANSKLSKRSNVDFFDKNQILKSINMTGGTLHPSGMIKIGSNIQTDDLDLNFKVHGTKNLYCLTSAALPTITAVNPVMTTLLLGCQLGEHIVNNDF